MPIYQREQIGTTELIIWHITEEEEFFTIPTNLSCNKIHLRKRLEYLASRYCLQLLKPELDLTEIKKDNDGKPYFESMLFDFSISHSYPYVAVAVDNNNKIGIDIQTNQEKILRLQHKFLSLNEMSLTNNEIENITFAWCCKEAMYKKYALGGLDFKANMPIIDLKINDKYASGIIDFNFKDEHYLQNLIGNINESFAWALTIE